MRQRRGGRGCVDRSRNRSNCWFCGSRPSPLGQDFLALEVIHASAPHTQPKCGKVRSMELRQYWKILKRRLWLIIVALLAFLVSYWLFRPSTPSSFTTSMRFVVGIKPEVSSGSYYTYDRYYTWLTADNMIDDFSEVVKSV